MFRGRARGPRRPRLFVGAWIIVLILAFATSAPSLAAQVWIGADATFATRYVRRGVIRASNPVVQPSAFAALAIGPSFLTTGGWWNFELERASATDLTLVGADARGAGEVDVWVEYATREPAFDWAVGVWHYRVSEGRTSSTSSARASTSELYASASTIHQPIGARVSAWFDIRDPGAAYYELEVSHALGTHPLGEIVGSLFLGSRVGLSHGHAAGPAADADVFQFGRDGIVFYEGFAELAFELHIGSVPLVLNLSPRYEFESDPAARRRSLDRSGDRARFFWLETSLSWRAPLAGLRNGR